VFGPYLVYEQLGSGGMARVDRAEFTGIEGFQRQVALKRMLPHVASNDDMVKAFVREARLASHLRHGNVAQTYELGKVDGIYFIAMELITGPTLRAVLKHCAQTTGPMPVPIALNILNQICDALDYAHNLCDELGQPLGIIHRDVSPSNIIIDDNGVTKLIDFGIAKVSAAGMQTMSGTIKGKFGYMAPEYIVGRIDARADLFAIGVIAHELLTNRPLFSVADDMETLRRVRQMPLQPPSAKNPNVPPEIDDVVMTALSRDPDRRWQQATALRTALTTLTRRLGLICTNQQMVEWIRWLFDHAKPHGIKLPGVGARETEPSDPSLLIEPASVSISGPTRPELRTPHRLGAQGTPAQSITAEPTLPTLQARRPEDEEYRAAADAYGRYEGLGAGGRATEDVVTTLLRPSAPRIEAQQLPPRTIGPARTRGLTEPPPRPSEPAVHNVTLLGGGAALRNRSSQPSSQPPLQASLQPSLPPPSSPGGPRRPSSPSSPPGVGGIQGQAPPLALTIPSSSPPIPAMLPVALRGEPAPSGAAEAQLTNVPPERRSSAVVVVVLVLLAAGLAAAVVYLVLPHLT